MAKLLRSYWGEYSNRLLQHGPHSLPASFNVVQAFLTYTTEFRIFDLRREFEHLIRLSDYFDWYTSEQRIPDDPKILIDVIQDGVIYSYEVVGDTGDYTISTEGSRLAIAGVSLVRQKNELAIIILSGENPPHPPDSDVSLDVFQGRPFKGREKLSPDKSYTTRDRYLDGMTGFAKVLLLTRFNLENKQHDVRYLNIDCGPSYMVHTDDSRCFDPDPSVCSELKKNQHIENSIRELERYNQLFSALSCLIYLPIMFIAEKERVRETTFTTKLGTSTQKPDVKKAIKEFGREELPLSRTIFCLSSHKIDNHIAVGPRTIDPPDFTFETTGFWKPIGPNEIGEDTNGNPIMGQTWVERIESYSVKSAERFVLSKQEGILTGNDPGTVYIMRNPSHGNDLYKIGITRRSTEQRAQELGSSTASPLPFGVLARWEVGDCASVEKEVHKKLKAYRVSKRREFFFAPLSYIIHTIEQTIAGA